MAFFHLRTLPGCRWPALPDSVFAQVWNAYLELDRTQWLDPAELVRRQLKQVRTLLAHCLGHVPYYRDVLAAARIVPAEIQTLDDFRRLPLLPRRVYQEQGAAAQATQLPAGSVATDVSQTSGSSGTPISVFRTNVSQLWWHAFFLRDLEWCNIDPTLRLAAIRNMMLTGPAQDLALKGTSTPCWSPALDRLIQSGPAYGMDIRQAPRVQLQWLRRVAPAYLLSLPANLEVLAALVRRDAPLPGLRGIQSIASTLSPAAQAEIESAFGVPVKNTYSCFEAGYLASPCPQGHGLHVHAENVLLELLDENDRPCSPGQAGRVFITHLHNLRGPFVRYELGDEATMAHEACPCGRGLPLLARVQGKNYPMFHLAGGRLKHCASLGSSLRQVGGHWQHQMVQQAPDHVVLRVAVDPAWTAGHAEQMKRIVHDFFEAPVRIDLEIHDRLALPANGKFQSMICAIDAPAS